MIDYTTMREFEIIEYYIPIGNESGRPLFAFQHRRTLVTESPFFSKRDCLDALKRFVRYQTRQYGKVL